MEAAVVSRNLCLAVFVDLAGGYALVLDGTELYRLNSHLGHATRRDARRSDIPVPECQQQPDNETSNQIALGQHPVAPYA